MISEQRVSMRLKQLPASDGINSVLKFLKKGWTWQGNNIHLSFLINHELALMPSSYCVIYLRYIPNFSFHSLKTSHKFNLSLFRGQWKLLKFKSGIQTLRLIIRCHCNAFYLRFNVSHHFFEMYNEPYGYKCSLPTKKSHLDPSRSSFYSFLTVTAHRRTLFWLNTSDSVRFFLCWFILRISTIHLHNPKRGKKNIK